MAASISEKLSTFCVVVNTKQAQNAREILELEGLWDSTRRLVPVEDGYIGIPVTDSARVTRYLKDCCGIPVVSDDKTSVIPATLSEVYPVASKKSQMRTPYQELLQRISKLFTKHGGSLSEELKKQIPANWEKHGDLILLPESAFASEFWKVFGDELWKSVCSALDCKKIGRKSSVTPDKFRSSSVMMLFGDSGWVEHNDNGIRYCYDVTKCMFSIGNITEKLRIAKLDCSKDTVVDLYAGIGYFTLPYLVHAKAHFVYACEWNPHAVEALRRNLQVNGCSDRCEIREGDNRQGCPKNVADRVNLGLIPSSEDGWQTACESLRSKSGGVLHIHHNVSSKNYISPQIEVNSETSEFSKMSHNISSCKKDGRLIDGRLDSMNCVEKEAHIGVTSDTEWNELTFDLSNNFSDSVSQQDHNDSADLTQKQTFMRHKVKMKTWNSWALQTSQKIKCLLEAVHAGIWTVEILHIEHVKSYAPHIDHIVLDLDCRPNS